MNDPVHDRMPAVMARLLAGARPGTWLGAATPLALVAALLARERYRPDLWVLGSQGRVGRPLAVGWLAQEDLAWGAPGGWGVHLEEVFRAVGGGRLRIWIGPAQVDRHGNANISRIGPQDRPRPALVGSRGLPDDAALLPEGLYYLVRSDPRSFVERVDHVTAAGDPALRPVGSRAVGRPAWLVTPEGVYDFGGPGGTARLRAVFAGEGPEGLPRVAGVSAEERKVLEQVDPLGARRLEFATGEELARLRAEVRQGEERLIAKAFGRGAREE